MRRSVIPTPAWVVAGVLLMLGLFCLVVGVLSHKHEAKPAAIIGLVSILLSGYSLLIGYVYGDGKRRGMRYVMWTWLAILVPNAIGIILYFILREPISNYCTGCGLTVRPGFGYCPRCGTAIAASCPRCNRVSQEGWTHCGYCGARL